MRPFIATLLAGLISVPTAVLAHYNFEALIVNGKVTEPYEYVRRPSNSNGPITDIKSPDFVCNKGGLDPSNMAKTSTYTVAPGDTVGFTINVNIGHPGPLSVWLSKAPDGTTAAAYDGSGGFFKVYQLTTSSITSQGLQWATYPGSGISNFNFALPAELAAGDYLMRVEHIALHGASKPGGAQFYLGCAQITVSTGGLSSSNGTPATVPIPGVYTGDEPGLVINIYFPTPTSYQTPGPATWPKGCDDHTANLLGTKSDGDCTGDENPLKTALDSGGGNGIVNNGTAGAIKSASENLLSVSKAQVPTTNQNAVAAHEDPEAKKGSSFSTFKASGYGLNVSSEKKGKNKSKGSKTCKRRRAKRSRVVLVSD